MVSLDDDANADAITMIIHILRVDISTFSTTCDSGGGLDTARVYKFGK